MRQPRRAASLFFLLVGAGCLGLMSPVVIAQTKPTKLKTRIVTKTELVEISVVVFDQNGRVATNLHKDDFRVREDGVQQRILTCERERIPVSFVILADVSSSMTNKIPFVQQAAIELVQPPEREEEYVDEYSLLGIETHARPLVPFSDDSQDLEHRIPWLLKPTNGSTALFDGIYLGVTTAERTASNKHRAMIVISDGGDNHSRYKLLDVKRLVEEADMPVFAVTAGSSFELPPFLSGQRGPAPPGGPLGRPVPNLPELGGPDNDYIGPAERRGPDNLKTIAEASGGGVFTAKNAEDLPRIVRTIGEAVRYRYLLTYEPAGKQPSEMPANGNGWHKIQLELYPKEKFKGFSVPYYKRKYRSID